jgi:hypothetical protein
MTMQVIITPSLDNFYDSKAMGTSFRLIVARRNGI